MKDCKNCKYVIGYNDCLLGNKCTNFSHFKANHAK